MTLDDKYFAFFVSSWLIIFLLTLVWNSFAEWSSCAAVYSKMSAWEQYWDDFPIAASWENVCHSRARVEGDLSLYCYCLVWKWLCFSLWDWCLPLWVSNCIDSPVLFIPGCPYGGQSKCCKTNRYGFSSAFPAHITSVLHEADVRHFYIWETIELFL